MLWTSLPYYYFLGYDFVYVQGHVPLGYLCRTTMGIGKVGISVRIDIGIGIEIGNGWALGYDSLVMVIDFILCLKIIIIILSCYMLRILSTGRVEGLWFGC